MYINTYKCILFDQANHLYCDKNIIKFPCCLPPLLINYPANGHYTHKEGGGTFTENKHHGSIDE